ncbi:MAG TPA: hypothetical protein VGH27_20265 [Streptosporangiaceae bacterium]|jgi:hypothetical protein
MADTRDCEQCGRVFEPRREHARFCSARCRVAWNRENARDPATGTSALAWSMTAMRDATGRLARVRAQDGLRAFTVIGEAVWWVTIVDGTLVRHHPQTYDRVLAAQGAAERGLIEGTLGGLRFVRNQMGRDIDHLDFIRPAASSSGPGSDRITSWTWNPMPQPTLEEDLPCGQEWELARHRAYQDYLADRTIGKVFGRAAAFLRQAGVSSGLASSAASSISAAAVTTSPSPDA